METNRSNLTSDQFKQLLLGNIPLMDVRAPVEFSEGAFPASVNVPILDDEQRHLIGAAYASDGQQSAVELGHRLATPELRLKRLQDWQKFVADNPTGYLYCFRGGLRSRITQQWLKEAGCHYPLIEGGYKALRRFLLGELERLSETSPLLVLSGATGVGKTEVIVSESPSIDLEGRAKHRGSAFGQTVEPQPAQISWENQVIIDWLRSEAEGHTPILIEAESHLIGRIHLPSTLQAAMKRARIIVLKASLEDRSQRLFDEYVIDAMNYSSKTDEEPWTRLQQSVQVSLNRIKKRLGGVLWAQLSEQLVNAISALREHHDASEFRAMIETLLEHYYDPLYQYHQTRNQERIVFQGSRTEVDEWIRQNKRTAETSTTTTASTL